MSLQHEINKVSGDVRRFMGQIARQGMTGMDGAIRGTKKIYGYVCAIHEDGELAGTVDVQEFNYEPDEYPIMGTGHHKGVFLSAIQNNQNGVLIVPMLYSEVTIIQNPTDGNEYVIMYSHAQTIKHIAHSIEGEDKGEIEIGVFETEKPVETDDGLEKDYDQLEPTKNKANTIYKSTSITDQVVSPDDEIGFKEEKTVEHKIITVGDTKITIDGENVSIETSGKVSFIIGGTTITEEDGSVKIKTDSCEIKGSDIKVDGGNVTITGGNLKTKGVSSTDLQGPFNAIKVCPFSGAPHCGSSVSGT
ncbi:hypothetical protein [Prevotella sp. MGM2]|uniref:hypothetical protein n=1 Tax=Prevotella sp. MGM2 TaxID=2033406 RepID=UPI000CE9DF7A|nr:hypothetical protein [Prevotella sp. MGM2]GAY30667.1 hypothetical protein PvtlMGM2_1520 [Prevotella sp. MGM2]